MELQAGAQIDRYTLIEKLGEGGQGSVFRAEDRLQPGRSVALKLVPLAVAAAVQVERVRREARHLARLNHPGLPACHGLFEDLQHGLLVVAMEFVEGTTLHEARAWLDESQRVAVLRHLISVLAFLHGSGVVHRDVKLDNVIVSPGFRANPSQPGSIKLIDLGISVASGNPQPLTVVGHIIGTPSYMAPEILDPHYFPGPEDAPAADVFAFGVLGWSLLFGEHPAGLGDGASMASYALAYRQADQVAQWPPAARGDRWEQWLRRCVAVRARERFASATEVLSALAAIDVGAPSMPSPAQPPSMRERHDLAPSTALPQDAFERRSSLPATRVEPIASATPLPVAAYTPAPGLHASATPAPAAVHPTAGHPYAPPTAPPATPPMGPAPSAFGAPQAGPGHTAPGGFAGSTAPGLMSPGSTAPGVGPGSTAPGLAGPGHTAPGGATVLAAPLAFFDEPSRSSAPPVAPTPLPSAPLLTPAPPMGPIPVPAAPAPSVAPAPSRFARRAPGPLDPKAQSLPVPVRPADVVPAPSPRVSLLRMFLAAVLLVIGGAAAFGLAVIVFVLFQLSK